MAIRYSGDVETRSTYDARRKHWWVGVAAPGGFRTRVALRDVRRRTLTPDEQDHLARRAIRQAEHEQRVDLPAVVKRGRIEVLRVFQAGCPV